MDENTLLEQSMKEIQEENFKRSMQEHNFAATQMNWRPESTEHTKRATVLRGHAKMLMLLNRARK